MLQELIGLAVNVTDCDACLVYLVDKGRKEIVLRASQLPHAKEIGHIKLKMGEGITGWVAQNKSVVALGANASADSRFKSFQKLQEDTFEAFLSVPLISEGELIGVINIHHKTRARPHAGRNRPGHLPRRTDGRRHHQEPNSPNAPSAPPAAWRRWSDSPASSTKTNYLDRILQTIAEMVADKLDSPVCSIMLVDEDRKELVISAARCSSRRLPPPHAAQDRGFADRPRGARRRSPS